jgi:hypothetical protein
MLYEKVTGRRFVVSLNRPLISDVTEWLATEVTGAMVAFAWGGLGDCGARDRVRFPTGKIGVSLSSTEGVTYGNRSRENLSRRNS